jgi:hypothetical protein
MVSGYEVLLRLTSRLAEKHWDRLDWDPEASSEAGRSRDVYKGLARDEAIRGYSADRLLEQAGSGLNPLDDLAILVLFSVFEAVVRDRVRSEVEREGAGLRHLALRHALRETLDRIDEGSFFRILEPFKSIDGDVIEQVNQVRRYRNWVAHGRRDAKRPDYADPRAAYDRLSRFLELLARSTIQPGDEDASP